MAADMVNLEFATTPERANTSISVVEAKSF
jgi:hypothetical protein